MNIRPTKSNTRNTEVLERSLDTILAATSTPENNLASGSAAAISVAVAAALTSSVARALEAGIEASGFAVQAENVRARAESLVDRNREDYGAAREALDARLGDPGFRDHRIGVAMQDTIKTLGLIASTGADTAELAAKVTELSPDALKPDVVSATVLAESGARVATILIRTNLLITVDSEDLQAAEAELASARNSMERAGKCFF
jgi:formiminotetrahydrofolate cyclodeaminase